METSFPPVQAAVQLVGIDRANRAGALLAHLDRDVLQQRKVFIAAEDEHDVALLYARALVTSFDCGGFLQTVSPGMGAVKLSCSPIL